VLTPDARVGDVSERGVVEDLLEEVTVPTVNREARPRAGRGR
jgi:hypothetical protein